MASQLASQNRRVGGIISFLLVALMIGTPLANFVSGNSQAWTPNEENSWDSEVSFSPNGNLTYVNETNGDMFQVPANHTITAANLSLSSFWNPVSYQNSTFGSNQSLQWNGSLIDTEIKSNNQHLTLEKVNTANNVDDFEIVSTVPSGGWLTNGIDGEVWTIVQNNTTLTSSSNMNLPISGFENTSFLSTTGKGDLQADVDACIRSPIIDLPRVINNYSLTFKHWLALDTTDTISLKFLDDNHIWTDLPFSSTITTNGNSDEWQSVNISLDNHFTQYLTTTHLQFCIQTSQLPSLRGGWFIDELTLFNEGDQKGAWFHGNFSGNYLPNAVSEFIIPANLSSFPYLDELEINANWDIQGYLHDYLVVEFSFDNGASWNVISGNYGIPGLGVWHNGNLYYAESRGWVPIYLPIVHNFTNSGGLNNTLFKFTVHTNAGINFGGTSSSGWEGIAIDQLVFHHNRGSSQSQKYVFKDFNSAPSLGINSPDGWLQTKSSTPNQWQWTKDLGLSAQQFQAFSFNNFDELPPGWAISSNDNNKWEYGQIPSTAIYGPNHWNSGQYGLGIALQGKYTNEMYTHLISPEYSIPSSASSRLSFNSWVCTEANWDGGAISASTDGGINWWYLPPQIGTFHDQISTANTNSPFYGEGIFDGSNIANGCRNSSLPFQLKQYDISNLSGQEVRFRYSFFSDQLLELDGWYLDDAGIEIDLFKQNGTWISQPIYPDSNFGWAKIDGLVKEPTGTEVLFDIIDASSGELIDGYTNLTLPIDLLFNPSEINSIQVKAKLSSNNQFVTPSIEKIEMGVASYFDWYHATHSQPELLNNQQLFVDGNGEITANSQLEFAFNTNPVCPSMDTKITTTGANISYQSAYFTFYYDHQEANSMVSEFENSFSVPTLSDNVTVSLDRNSNLLNFHYMPQCVLPSQNISVGLIDENNMIYSDPMITGLNTIFATDSFSTVTADDVVFLPDNHGNYILTLQPNQVLNLSYYLLNHDISHTSVENTGVSIYAEIQSNIAGELQIYGNNEIVAEYSDTAIIHNIMTDEQCQNSQLSSNLIGINVGIATCTLSLYSTTEIDLKINNFKAISSVSEILVHLDPYHINSIKHQVENNTNEDVIDLPVLTKTDYGSTTTNLTYKSYLHQIDRVENIDKIQWLPGEELTIQTSHVRFNPITMSENGFEFDSVELFASIDSTISGAQFVIEASNLYSNTALFSIKNGAQKIILNQAKSNVNCNEGYCIINWTLQSTWHLDDIDDVVWMVTARDSDGLQTGPATMIRETQFNEIENDLEVFELSVFDLSNNQINDWTNPNWPYRLSEQNTLSVAGSVRFEGITNALIDEGDAEIEIRLSAIPPINYSGGTNEWPNEEVDWSMSWFTEVGPQGLFSKEIETPDVGSVPSNTTIQLSVHISRVGPDMSSNEFAIDQTSSNMKTRFIYDISSPSVASISIYDPSGLTPADGHIWTLNQDIPIQVIIEDVEGLSTELIVYTWAEYADDANGDSLMDVDEYRTTTVSVNYASNVAVLDIPAISWQEIKGPFESGRLSIVLAIDDLAGNELLNGGDFGEQNDAATIIVQDQLQTLMDSSALSLDLVNDNLLPSHQHTFIYSITDYNGIESLDKISIALVGRDSPSQCYIDYYPRFNSVDYDANCFSSQPIVEASKVPGMQKWYVETKFIISWSAIYSNSELSGIPSLKIFDDGQDLQLGTSFIRGLSWGINDVISVDDIKFNDTISPLGISKNGEIWANPDDIIIASSNLIYNDTNLELSSLSQYDQIGCKVNSADQPTDSVQFFDGKLMCQYSIPSNSNVDIYDIELWALSSNGQQNNSQTGMIFVDKESPILALELKDLLRLNSNQLSNVLFEGTVEESSTVIDQQLIVNWNILRGGVIVNDSPFTHNISIIQTNDDGYEFADFVNLENTDDYILSEGDELIIWLTFADNSGQALVGFATEIEPLMPRITWFDFDPMISLIELKSDNPINGESLKIVTRILNAGLESGNVSIILSDNSGKFLASQEIQLDGGKWQLVEWEIEAWTTGDIEIIVSLENYSESQLLLIEDVEEFESKQQDLMGTIGLVIVFLIVVVGGFSYAYLQRSKELEQYTKHHLAQIAIKKRERQRNIQESADLSQEE